MSTNSTKLNKLFDQLLSGNYDPVAAIVENEMKRGFQIIRPGDAPWLDKEDWIPATVASINGMRARLVLLHAKAQGKGALTRTIQHIQAHGLIPAIIDPTIELAAALKRRNWKKRSEGHTFDDRETVWTP